MPLNNKESSRFSTFNLVDSPLRGFNLIDASAGTGKTYTICGLVLRLLAEKNLSIDQVLVVTYTEAATEDLRDRIRQKLHQALEALVSGKSDDAFLQGYLFQLSEPAKVKQRLSDALIGFDEASIYTIHSFCRRVLQENSFESNILFDTELVADHSSLVQEIVEDFWRHHFYKSSPLFTEYIRSKINPDKLSSFLHTFLPRPYLQFIPEVEFAEECGQTSKLETEYCKAYRTVCSAWESSRSEVGADLLNSAKLKRTIYKQNSIQDLLNSMDDLASSGEPSFHLFDKFSLLTSSGILSGTRSNQVPFVLPFYEICDNLLQVHSKLSRQFNCCLLAIKKKLVDTIHNELEVRKTEKNLISFDDLLRNLHKGFTGPGGSAFAHMVAQKYPAVLIDEFQDTDPIQYKIFSELYDKGSLLFLIGDPKQAIYSFRGADIYTYMDAARSSQVKHHSLDTNYRSTPGLVKAVSTLFSSGKLPFAFEAIPFQPVSSDPEGDLEHLTIDGKRQEPFVLWLLDSPASQYGDRKHSDNGMSRLTKTAARHTIIKSVAAEVTRLLALAAENRISINGEKLHPGDIAILVRTNAEAGKIQQALTEARVPSVLHSGENLFTSEEAEELALLLAAIAAPQDMRKVKTGLLTRLLALHPDEIEPSSAAAGERLEFWLAKFKSYNRLWNRYGFIHMFWIFMKDNRVRAKMLKCANGERILANILHLAEILHQEECNKGLHMTALLGYLQDRLTGNRSGISDHQLRLESDADRVKIVTVHKAKGLEYQVVFCPFTWEGSRLSSGKGCVFHQQTDGGNKTALIYDEGSSELDNHLQIAMKEELSENLRLLYVAVTRAVHRCYLAWGPIKGTETSAPAYLLHQGPEDPVVKQKKAAAHDSEENLIHQTMTRFLQLSDNDFKADLKALADNSEGTISIVPVTEAPSPKAYDTEKETRRLKPRKFSGTVAADWRITSFSSLTTLKAIDEEIISEPDTETPGQDDSAINPLPNEVHSVGKALPDQSDILFFPHGARAGTMLHQLLEQVDFSSVDKIAPDLLEQKLKSFGYDPGWQPAIAEMLTNLSRVPLHSDIPGLTLSDVPPASCLHELEFYFPLSRTTPADLKKAFGKDMSSVINNSIFERQLDRLIFSPVRGFMKGFIDLVFEYQGKFYLADWKSNYLGSLAEDYNKERIIRAMNSGYYFLQYHLYCLALHLYLKSRLPEYDHETHFGGAFCIFLRGVRQNLGPNYGIYYDLPEPALIQHITKTLLAEYDRQELTH
jgi:exodeoxyribonuclease V beta subunit